MLRSARPRASAPHHGRAARSLRDREAAHVRAQALIDDTGGRSPQPFLHVERAALLRLADGEPTARQELYAAHRLFTEMGATARAEQVARELA